jgi:multidrug efflux pump subunit AcrB
LSAFGEYTVTKAITSIQRQDTDITITIASDVQEGITPTVVQTAVDELMRTYKLPTGIRYEQGGENQENADLIQTTVTAFIVSLLLIFGILVLQFNSYSQPIIIMYTVLMGFLGANIGLYVTGNSYSMSFGIGFIALTGIVVNIAIVFIDKINTNVERGMAPIAAVIDSGRTRLQPIILTQLNTVFGLLPTALQDKFFAGLSYTVMFGLAITTMLTVFVIPLLYLERARLVHVLKRGILAPLVWVIMCVGAGMGVVLLLAAL